MGESLTVGALHIVVTSERTHQHQECGFVDMEIRDQSVHASEIEGSWTDEEIRVTCVGFQMKFPRIILRTVQGWEALLQTGCFQGPDRGRPDRDDPTSGILGRVDQVTGLLRNLSQHEQETQHQQHQQHPTPCEDFKKRKETGQHHHAANLCIF